MEKISIGINRNGAESEISGKLENSIQLRVQGRLASQNNQIRAGAIFLESNHPCLNRIKRQQVIPVLVRVNVTVSALEIALRQDMEKQVGGML
jgi:hypothetical protein